jgi:HPt (histidine-containing phosphotransfer) domain-containing protein
MTDCLRTTAGAPREADEATGRRPILDWAYFERQTLGDQALQHALLSLFVETSAVLLDRLEAAGAAARRDLAHTLRGAAMAIGAHRVAEAAAGLEHAGGAAESASPDEDTCAQIRIALAEAHAAIAARLAG